MLLGGSSGRPYWSSCSVGPWWYFEVNGGGGMNDRRMTDHANKQLHRLQSACSGRSYAKQMWAVRRSTLMLSDFVRDCGSQQLNNIRFPAWHAPPPPSEKSISANCGTQNREEKHMKIFYGEFATCIRIEAVWEMVKGPG